MINTTNPVELNGYFGQEQCGREALQHRKKPQFSLYSNLAYHWLNIEEVSNTVSWMKYSSDSIAYAGVVTVYGGA